MSAHELAKRYNRPLVADKFPIITFDEIVVAHKQLLSKRNLTPILRLKAFTDNPVHVGYLVDVYVSYKMKNAHNCLDPSLF